MKTASTKHPNRAVHKASSPPNFSVIIPAHNEEAVIERCLSTLSEDIDSDSPIEIIVVANGCNDKTAEIARSFAPQISVIDLPEGSKTKAINAGIATAKHRPVFVLDADVVCPLATLSALAIALESPDIMTASPALRLNLDGASWAIRAYYRMWLRQPYARAGKGGAGCYGLSKSALNELGSFPDIIADDIWVHTRFHDKHRAYLEQDVAGKPVFTVVRPPRTAIGQIRVEARRQIGTQEVIAHHPSSHQFRSGGQQGLRNAFTNASSAADFLIFFGMKLSARLLARWSVMSGRSRVWTRDLTTRRA